MLSFSSKFAWSIPLLTLAIAIWHRTVKSRLSHRAAEGPEAFYQNVTNEEIVPLAGLDWKATEPLQYRPYKPKFYMSMALEKISASDLIQIDKTYLERIAERRQLLDEHFEVVVGAKEEIAAQAVAELYTWLVNVYLPKRFPTIFSIRVNLCSSRQELWNNVTKEWHPLKAGPTACETLRALGTIVEEDFIFLLPDANVDSYIAVAFISCFPNSFNARSLLGRNLRDFHVPVPGYAEKLERSVDRWFRNLPAGKFSSRCNWSLTPYDKLFTPKGHRLTAGIRKEAHAVELDPNDMFLRAERQVLHRLPQSGAIVFCVRQYMYAVRDIKEEGSGEAFAEAIDGLKLGNAPDIYYYKRAAEWGDAVKRYLRS